MNENSFMLVILFLGTITTIVTSLIFMFFINQSQKIRFIDAFSILEREKDYLIKHQIIVREIMFIIPIAKKSLNSNDLKAIQKQLSKHIYKSYTLIRQINNIIVNVGYQYFDKNGRLIETKFNYLRDSYKGSFKLS